ncbi:MAG TPA: ABC transporter ATP-binding protein [Candidatus Saccharimonadales bacterium]|nr:ABC transporter ATP-binding protein [Candidatus Saccharimonadales bacterium]
MQLLSAKDIQKSYRKNHVLRGIDITVSAGTLVAIVGENGSGKSTLLKVLAGELASDSGSVQIEGTIGYCPQQPVVNEALTVGEHLGYFKEAYRLPNTDYADHLLNVLHFSKFKDEQVGNLSGGTCQKLNLTLALMHQPSVLLLDEPYQGFDWETYLRFWDVVEELKRSGKAIVVISHLIFEQKKFDHILHLHNGRIREVRA